MGVGIAGIIPIELKIEEKDYFHDDYLEAFDLCEETGYYLLKSDLLFKYFKSFLISFNDIIENTDEIWINSKWDALDELAANKDYEGYLNYLADNSNRWVPFYEGSGGFVSVLGMRVSQSIVFYSGSYKAFLEEYSTLSDMEKLLAKALANPLSKVTKFCIFG